MDNLTKIAFITEDDQDICTLLSCFVKSVDRSMVTITAQTLAMAKKISGEINPSVIFIDHRLPDGYGFDFIAELRVKFPDIPIIAMTAQNMNETKLNALNVGASHYLEKPFKMKEVQDIIENLEK